MDRDLCFSLPEPDMISVISCPCQPEEVALPLPRPERQLERQVEVSRGLRVECGFVSIGPDVFGAGSAIEAARSFARIQRDKAAIVCP